MKSEIIWQPIYVEGRGVVRVLATLEEIAKLRDTNPNLCKHPKSELRDYTTSNGGLQRKEQCLTCGIVTSQAMSRKDGTSVPDWDTSLNKSWEQKCADSRSEIEEYLIERTENTELEGYAYYEEYLKSEAWINTLSAILDDSRDLLTRWRCGDLRSVARG